MKLVTVSEMKAIEKEADAKGLTYEMMMENAGSGVARVILEMDLAEEDEPQALALVGPGNNGGDALVALAQLAAQEWDTRAYVVSRKVKDDPLIDRLRQAGGEIVLASEDESFDMLRAFMETSHVLLDGVLGTGIKLPLKREVAAVLAAASEAISEMDDPPYVVAVDCPSGVDCDTGEAAPEAIPASMTVCMAAIKHGLLRFPAFDLAGELLVADIGLAPDLHSWAKVRHHVADAEMVETILPARPDDAHKGTFGTALVAAGSINYTGAALLAGKAAYRAGAGLVTLAVPAPLHATLAGHFPEATWIILPHEMGVIAASAADVLAKNLDRATALLVGPGFGLEDATREFIESLLKGGAWARKSAGRIGFIREADSTEQRPATVLPPMVVDADGLKLLAKIEGWPKLLPAGSVLTPHPGEMAVLTGVDKAIIQEDRLGTAQRYAAEWGHVVVLKGAFTVIAAPEGQASVVPVATSALARAGTGDVLAGIIVGLRAQGVEAYEAAIAGAWIHAQAGIAAADRIGNTASVLAGDVLEAIPDVLWGMA
jgi:NAD(P)H-hydrate epimerase